MSVRLVILVLVAGALAVSFAMRSSAPPPEEENVLTGFLPGEGGKNKEDTDAEKQLIWEQSLPGEEPPEELDLSVQVRVDTSAGKDRLSLYITEAHGYYADFFNVQIWYINGGEETTPEDSPLSFIHLMNRYLKANETLKDCLELVPAELARIGEDIGDDENWGAEILSYRRARARNPDPLPIVTEMHRCD